jgi:Fungal trichothecene efflux pump (TRI12)
VACKYPLFEGRFRNANHHSVGGLSAGKLTNRGPSGWRDVYWLQAALHLSNSLLFFIAYFPPRKSDYERQRLSWKEYLWCLDPIGTFVFIAGATLVILALDWAPDTYAYSNPHVAVTLAIGLLLLVIFGLYGRLAVKLSRDKADKVHLEWKGRPDGLVSHAYFKHGPNFGLATFAFGVEG